MDKIRDRFIHISTLTFVRYFLCIHINATVLDTGHPLCGVKIFSVSKWHMEIVISFHKVITGPDSSFSAFSGKGPFRCLVETWLGLLFTQRSCRLEHFSILEYLYSSDIVVNMIKILFLQKFEAFCVFCVFIRYL